MKTTNALALVAVLLSIALAGVLMDVGQVAAQNKPVTPGQAEPDDDLFGEPSDLPGSSAEPDDLFGVSPQPSNPPSKSAEPNDLFGPPAEPSDPLGAPAQHSIPVSAAPRYQISSYSSPSTGGRVQHGCYVVDSTTGAIWHVAKGATADKVVDKLP